MDRARRGRIFYGWFVLFGAAAIVSVAYSMRYSFSVFYKAILNEFGWSRAGTAAAFSVNMFVYGISSPFVGTFVDRFGPKGVLIFGASLLSLGLLGMSQMNSIWLFYLLFGIVMAIGMNSLGYAVHNSYLPNWFQERRGLAFGILTMSSGAASAIASQYQWLILWINWRRSYMLMSILSFATIVPLVIFLIKRTPQEMGLLPDSGGSSGEARAERSKRLSSLIVDRGWAEKDWTIASAAREPRFWLLFFSQMCVSIVLNMNTAHQAIHCQDIGFNPIFAAGILGLVGVISMTGNFLSAISDRIGREETFTIGVIGTVVAVFCLMQASGNKPWLLYAYAIIWGVFFGTGSPSLVSGLADMFSGKHFGSVNGLFMVGWGMGGAIGPWLGGFIYDTSGSYRYAFIAMMVSMMLGGILFWLAAPRKIRLVPGKAVKAGGKL